MMTHPKIASLISLCALLACHSKPEPVASAAPAASPAPAVEPAAAEPVSSAPLVSLRRYGGMTSSGPYRAGVEVRRDGSVAHTGSSSGADALSPEALASLQDDIEALAAAELSASYGSLLSNDRPMTEVTFYDADGEVARKVTFSEEGDPPEALTALVEQLQGL